MMHVEKPLQVTDMLGNLDVIWSARGGGRAARRGERGGASVTERTKTEPAGGATETWRVRALPLGLDEDEGVLLARACDEAGLDPRSLVKSASRALYRAKNSGRNRVQVAKKGEGA